MCTCAFLKNGRLTRSCTFVEQEVSVRCHQLFHSTYPALYNSSLLQCTHVSNTTMPHLTTSSPVEICHALAIIVESRNRFARPPFFERSLPDDVLNIPDDRENRGRHGDCWWGCGADRGCHRGHHHLGHPTRATAMCVGVRDSGQVCSSGGE